MFLHPNTQLVPLRSTSDPVRMLLALPIGDNINWLIKTGRLKMGESLVILGTGQKAAAAVLIGRLAGAYPIIVVARPQSKRIELFRSLADYVFTGDGKEVVNSVAKITNRKMASVVIELTYADALKAPALAVKLAGLEGRVVQVADHSGLDIPLPLDDLLINYLSVLGTNGHDYEDYKQAAELLERGAFPLAEKLPIPTFRLEQIEEVFEKQPHKEGGVFPAIVF